MQLRFRVLAGILVCIICIFESWFLGGFQNGLSHPASRGNLVDSYADALALKKPYLLTRTAKLVELPSDKQPPTDPSSRILDASYFHGKYYVYYGLLPFVVAFAPWKAATGSFLNAESYISVVLAAGNFFLCFAFLRLGISDSKKRVGVSVALGVAIAILCSGTFTLMDNPEIHEVESATGYLLNCAIFFGLVGFEVSGRAKFKYLGLAVGAAALLMSCRPNQICSTIWISCLAIGWVVQAGISRQRKVVMLVAIFFVPVTAGAALSVYNYIRFGSIVEFGMKYGTGAVVRPEVVRFSVDRIWYNLNHYLLGGFQTESYFPFITGPLHPENNPLPPYHEGLDQVYGAFIIYPALLLCICAFYYRRILSIALVLPAVGSLFILSGLGFGTYRYLVDFLTFFAAVAGIGGMEFCASQNNTKYLRLGAVFCLTISSAVGAICVAASIASVHGLFDIRRYEDFQSLARPFNFVRYSYERTLGPGPRFTAFELSFPEKIGGVEPLLVTGRAGLQDFLFIHYADAKSIRIGFESMGRGGKISLPIPIDYGKSHRIDVIFGNAMPPPDHPLFLGRSKSEIDSLHEVLEVYIDGISEFRAQIQFHPRGGYQYVGYSPFDRAYGPRFTGQLKEIKGMSLKNYLRQIR